MELRVGSNIGCNIGCSLCILLLLIRYAYIIYIVSCHICITFINMLFDFFFLSLRESVLENVEKRSEFVHTQRIAVYKSYLLLLFIKTRAVPRKVCGGKVPQIPSEGLQRKGPCLVWSVEVK